MGQVLHGSAKTTHAIRAAIQRSQASIKELSERYDLNPKTVAKWKKRDFIDDAPMGPKDVHSTVLSVEEEALAVAFRKHTLLPLDDCLYALQATIPQLTRSSLHRCLQRHGMSRLPDMAGDRPKKRFKTYPIGYFHIDIAEVRTEEGRLYLFVAVDRTSKFAHAELREKATRKIAAAFLQTLIEIVPYRVHTVLTDNGIQFTDLPRNRTGPTARYSVHLFDRVCNEHGIEHRLTKPNHPWTNGQVERMNRTLKEATVKKYHYETHQNLRDHLQTFLMAYNFAKRLKTLKGLTSYEFICKCWTEEPKKFRLNPMHHTSGLNRLAPTVSVTVVPSARVALTSPVIVSTRPITSGATRSPICAYCPGARGPASRAASSGRMIAPPSVARVGGFSTTKYSAMKTREPSGRVTRRSFPTREKSASRRAAPSELVSRSPVAALRTKSGLARLGIAAALSNVTPFHCKNSNLNSFSFD